MHDTIPRLFKVGRDQFERMRVILDHEHNGLFPVIAQTGLFGSAPDYGFGHLLGFYHIRICDGESEIERASFVFFALYPDRAAVQLDEFLGERQAQASTVVLA